jgi:glycerol uptake operon antiterminator
MLDCWKGNPVIAAIKDYDGACAAADAPPDVVFVLGGTLQEVPVLIGVLREAGKRVLLHADLIDGLGRSDAAVEFIARTLRPDGLLSTHRPVLRAAKREGLVTVQRLFMLDSASMATGVRAIAHDAPDFIELMPGVIPKAIAYFRTQTGVPVIAGGMITTREEARLALEAGAAAVSTSERALWTPVRAAPALNSTHK